jgi:hypothetical protein
MILAGVLITLGGAYHQKVSRAMAVSPVPAIRAAARPWAPPAEIVAGEAVYLVGMGRLLRRMNAQERAQQAGVRVP